MLKQRIAFSLKQSKGKQWFAAILAVTISGVCAFGVLAVGQEPKSVQPISTANPKYPVEAAKQGIDGYVDLQFDIDQAGVPQDVQIVAEQPEQVFGKSAIAALAKWRYPAGNAQTAVVVRLEFKLADN